MATEKKRTKKSTLSYIIEIFLCIVALAAITVSLLFLVKNQKLGEQVDDLETRLNVYEDPENPYITKAEADELVASETDLAYNRGREESKEELLDSIKKDLLETNSALETFKIYYPDELIVIDSNQYYFFPILDTIAHHSFADADFVKGDDGRISYKGDAASMETWIDVSKFQEEISWKEVAKDGIDGAIIRLGYRGYTKGDLIDDETFEYNIKHCTAVGLKTGVYFLTQAVSDKEAKEEAEYVIEHIADYDIEGPIVIDVEMVGTDDSRGNALSMEERTGYVKTFLDTVEAAGYEACIYGNLKSYLLMLDLEQLEGYSKWFAGYTDVPYFPYEMDMWQYTDTGRVKGIKGNVDIDVRFVK